MSALENELNRDTTEFEHFGRTWIVPTRKHLSHIKKMRDAMLVGIGSYDLLVSETFLSAEQFDVLLEIDPDEVALGDFAAEISNALGVAGRGNSEPSSASS